MDPTFRGEELRRYSRHFILPEVGKAGQAKLKAAKVLLIGTGGLGSPAAMYLAASGVGQLGLVDFDKVDLTNLHRQIIHGTSDVGSPKLDSATRSIADINPNVEVVKHEARLTSSNALEIMADYDLVVDGTDNFPTRYLVNDACVLLGKPNMYGSIFRFEGQATVFCASEGPCYRCLFPEPPPPGMVPSCADAGVLGVLPGIIGMIQATEAIKFILGIGEPLIGRLLIYDALGMRFTELRIRKDPACPACGESPSLNGLIDYEQFCGISSEPSMKEIEPADLAAMLEEDVPFTLLDVREQEEYDEFHIAEPVLIPLGRLPFMLGELNPESKTIVYCRSGRRSATACEILQNAGFVDVANLVGGAEAWLEEIDRQD